jgi:hypothetical protein
VSAIQTALNELNSKLIKLEAAVDTQEKKSAEHKQAVQQHQQDLFTAKAVNGNGKYAVDPAVLAGKLDMAIDKVEKILKEG